jgi:DNA-binding GntR family transcriptional regulator
VSEARDAERDAERYVRDGVPSFVAVYDGLRELIGDTGLAPGDPLPGDVALGGELGVSHDLVHEALLLLEEDGHLVRDRNRRWCVPAPARPAAITDSFHRLLSGPVRPVRRLHAAVEAGSSWTRELLRTDEPFLCWETVFAHDDVLLASTLEFMARSSVPEELAAELDAAKHDVAARPTLLEALGPERRARFSPRLCRLSQLSRSTERLSWMDLPLHGIPAALTVVLAEDGRPVYLSKNVFDLGTFDLVVDQSGAVT